MKESKKMALKDKWKEQAQEWFILLQSSICRMLENIEEKNGTPHYFNTKEWLRCDKTQENNEGGGGIMRLMHGNVFEKAGVNTSTVFGEFSPEFCGQIPGTEESPEFWASGISLVIHPKNPYVPIVHMNTRLIVTQKTWFGGGADLTPVFPYVEDTQKFHKAFEETCLKYDPNFYKDFSKWCEEYFYIKHRHENRGVGGIFYDYQYFETDDQFNHLFNFTKDVGKTLEKVYADIVLKHYQTPWDAQAEQAQSIKRARYVEFNLVYDRGTHFGFKTGGNIEAILMSMPPKAIWP
jgi:coproporphyrinogen III oxidase